MSTLATVYQNTAYLPASFFTRLYNITKQTYTLHPVLHEVHGPDLLQHENVVIPVARTGHWAGLQLDMSRRTTKYLDSYFQGGAISAKAMKAYLEDFKITLGGTQSRPWTCLETTQRRIHDDATQVYVPRQIRGDDYGVYLCIFAHLIAQKRQISEAEQG